MRKANLLAILVAKCFPLFASRTEASPPPPHTHKADWVRGTSRLLSKTIMPCLVQVSDRSIPGQQVPGAYLGRLRARGGSRRSASTRWRTAADRRRARTVCPHHCATAAPGRRRRRWAAGRTWGRSTTSPTPSAAGWWP